MRTAVMKAHSGTLEDLTKEGMIFEPKLDGIRALCFVNSHMRLVTRNGNDCTADYPEITALRSSIKAQNCILDGEIVAYDAKGRTNLGLLKKGSEATYVVFDILEKNGKSLIHTPLQKRKTILAETVAETDHLELMVFTADGKKLWQLIRRKGLEGVVAKSAQSYYYPGMRTHAWLKIKQHKTLDAVIVGYTTGRRALSSLALGLYDAKGILHYIGNVGTGFKGALIRELLKLLHPLERSKMPVASTDADVRDIIWTKPKLVAEIKYQEMTRYRRLRIPVFIRLREDKKSQECTFAAQR